MGKWKKIIVFGVISAHVFSFLVYPFTAWPEMLSFPYLFNNGFRLYSDFVFVYTPFLIFCLSIIYKIIGVSVVSMKIATLILIVIGDLLLFLILREVTKNFAATIFVLSIYILLQPILEGNMLWFDLATVPFVLGGIYLLLKEKILVGGIMFAIAALTKQNLVVMLIAVAVYILFSKRKKDFFIFLIGPSILALVFASYLIVTSSLSEFFMWTFWYPVNYWGSFPGYIQMQTTYSQKIILVLLMLPIVIGKLARISKGSSLVIVCTLCSLLLIYPRFSFFHFQLTLALICVWYGLVLEKVKGLRRYVAFIPLAFIVFVIPRPSNQEFFSAKTNIISNKIIEQTQTDDSVYLLNLHSGYYVTSNRLPPKPWVDTYGWYFEIPGVQQESIKKWEQLPPTLIVRQIPREGNWFDLGVYEPQDVLYWVQNNYTRDVENGYEIWKRKN